MNGYIEKFYSSVKSWNNFFKRHHRYYRNDRLSVLFDEVNGLPFTPKGDMLREKFFRGVGALSVNCCSSPRLLHPDFGRVAVKRIGDSRLTIKLKGSQKSLTIPFIADIARQYQF